jgi:hypothetical protein
MQLSEEEMIKQKMDKINTMFVPKGYPAPLEIDPNDDEQLYIGVE